MPLIFIGQAIIVRVPHGVQSSMAHDYPYRMFTCVCVRVVAESATTVCALWPKETAELKSRRSFKLINRVKSLGNGI